MIYSNATTARSTVLHYLDTVRKLGMDMSSLYSLFQYHMNLRRELDNGEVPEVLIPVSNTVHEHFWTAKVACGDKRQQEHDLLPLEMLAKDIISWDTVSALDTVRQLSGNPYRFM